MNKKITLNSDFQNREHTNAELNDFINEVRGTNNNYFKKIDLVFELLKESRAILYFRREKFINKDQSEWYMESWFFHSTDDTEFVWRFPDFKYAIIAGYILWYLIKKQNLQKQKEIENA